MSKVLIKCQEKLKTILITIIQNQKIEYHEQVQIADLIKIFTLQGKRGKQYVINSKLKITLYWNSNITLSTQNNLKFKAIMVICPNRVTFKSIQSQSAIVNSRSFYIEGKVIVKHLLYQHLRVNFQNQYVKAAISKKSELVYEDDQDQLTKKYQIISQIIKGKLKVVEKSRLKCKQLRVQDGDIVIAKDAGLKIISIEKQMLNLSKNCIYLYPFAKLITDTDFFIIAKRLYNWGYIGSEKKGMSILTKELHNHGRIDSDLVNIRCELLQNYSKAIIKTQKGVVTVEKQLHNQNQIACYELFLQLNKQTLSNKNKNKKIFFENSGKISCSQINANCSFLQNKGSIFGIKISIIGQSQKILFKNNGDIIPYKNLTIKNVIICNENQGRIISNGKVFVDLHAFINFGSFISNQNVVTSVKGLINHGNLYFNKDLILSAKNFENYSQFTVKGHSKMDINNIFLNQGRVDLYSAQINAKFFMSTGDLTSEYLKLRSQMTCFNGNLSCKNLSIQTLDFDISGASILANNMYIQVPFFINNSKYIQAKNFELKGISFHNTSLLLIEQSGKISLTSAFSTTKNSVTIINNTKISSGPVLTAKGKLYLKNVQFEGVKNFYHWDQLFIQNADYNFDAFSFNKLHMRNAHITTNILGQNGNIFCQGGSNSLNQVKKSNKINVNNEQFVLSIQSQQFAKSLKIFMNDCHHFKLAVTSNLNAYYVLDTPLVYGDFIKSVYAKKFYIPNSGTQQYEAKREIMGKNKDKSKWNLSDVKSFYLPKGNEKGLEIQIQQNCFFRANLSYSGNYLKFKSKNLQIVDSQVRVNDGLLELSAQETLKLTQCYIKAKGIQLKANQISDQASKYVAGLQGIFIESKSFQSIPVVNVNIKRGNGWFRKYQTAKRSTFQSDGDIVIKADEFLQLLSPQIIAKNNLRLQSNKIQIRGMFLLNEKTTKVQKSTLFGGKKQNIYYQRNDKQLPASLSAKNIQILGHQAKINANIKAEKLYDLTQQGVKLFFVIGYSCRAENRQFSNFCTKGYEGYQVINQKFLKANLKQLKQIYRPQELKGKMVFDTVQWGKVKTKIVGDYQEVITKANKKVSYWSKESVGNGVLTVVGIVAAFAGSQYLGPAILNSLQLAKAGTFSALAVKSATAVVAQKFSTGLVGTGSLQAALKSTFSSDTIISAAMNIGINGIVTTLSGPQFLGIQTKSLSDILKRNFLNFTVKTAISSLTQKNISNIFQQGIKQTLGDIIGEYGAYHIGIKFSNQKNINYIIHKGLHGVLGGLQGLILKGNKNGILSGLVAAMAAQIAIEAMVGHEQFSKVQKMILQNPQNKNEIINEVFQTQMLFAKIIGTVAGGFMGDINVAMTTAVNSIQNNFLSSITKFFEKFSQKIIQSQQQSGDLEKDIEFILKQNKIKEIIQSVQSYANEHNISKYQAFCQLMKKGVISICQSIKQNFNKFKKLYGEDFIKSVQNYRDLLMNINIFKNPQVIRELQFLFQEFVIPVYSKANKVLSSLFLCVSQFQEASKKRQVEAYCKAHNKTQDQAYKILQEINFFQQYNQSQILIPFPIQSKSICENIKKAINIYKKGNMKQIITALQLKQLRLPTAEQKKSHRLSSEDLDNMAMKSLGKAAKTLSMEKVKKIFPKFQECLKVFQFING